MDWMIAELQPALNPGFRMLLRTPPEQRDLALIETAIARTEALMAILDAHLAQRSYLANERFGMADIAVAPGAHRWLNLPVTRTPRPHVERWYEVVSARPAAKPALPVPIS
jgi:glutathione S-transferase